MYLNNNNPYDMLQRFGGANSLPNLNGSGGGSFIQQMAQMLAMSKTGPANSGFVPMQWPVDAKSGNEAGSSKDVKSAKPISGKGTIEGTEFKSGDGERWSPAVQAGKTYNLLSDKGIGLNGEFATIGGKTALSQIGLLANGAQITLAADGTLKIDGKDFRAGKNDLSGAIKRSGNTTTITTDAGYTLKLTTSASGISASIEGKDVGADGVAPEGLWGAAFDGIKSKADELAADLQPREYAISDVLSFDYEKNNNIGSKGGKTLDDDERTKRLWASQNPTYATAKMTVGSAGMSFGANGSTIANWQMKNLRANTPYLLFSDANINVSGTFGGVGADGSQPLLTSGIVVDGNEYKIKRDTAANGGNFIIADRDGNNVISGFKGSKSSEISFETTADNGEKYTVTYRKGANNSIEMEIGGEGVGKNKLRSGGILGDAMSARGDNGSDIDGAGYLRDANGKVSRMGQNMADALAEFELDDLLSTESGRGAYVWGDPNAATGVPQGDGSNQGGNVWGDPHFIGADGEMYDVQGKAGTVYNIFSDKEVQVNAEFGAWGSFATVMTKLGFKMNGQQVEVRYDAAKKPEVLVNGTKLEGPYNQDGIVWNGDTANPSLKITSTVDGETWSFEPKFRGGYFDLGKGGSGVGKNNVGSTGIWGHSIGGGDTIGNKGGNSYQNGGAGILRNKDGSVLAKGIVEKNADGTINAQHQAALDNYVETGLFSTSSFWSVFDGKSGN